MVRLFYWPKRYSNQNPMLPAISYPNIPNQWTKQISSPVATIEQESWDQQLADIEFKFDFEMSELRQRIVSLKQERKQLTHEWYSRFNPTCFLLPSAQLYSALGMAFFLLLSLWILMIGRSEAPYWWVPYLSLFFSVAALAALYDLLTKQSHFGRAQLRSQIRANDNQLARLQHRHEMLCGTKL